MPLFDLSDSSKDTTVKKTPPKPAPKAKSPKPIVKKHIKKVLTKQNIKEYIQKTMEEPKPKPQVFTGTTEQRLRTCKLNKNIRDIFGCQRCWNTNMKFTGKFTTRAQCGVQNISTVRNGAPATGA